MIFPTISQAITTGGFVAVRLAANCSCVSFSLWTEDGATYEISSESDGSDAINIVDGFPLSMIKPHAKEAAGAILCYAKGSTSTNLVGLVTK